MILVLDKAMIVGLFVGVFLLLLLIGGLVADRLVNRISRVNQFLDTCSDMEQDEILFDEFMDGLETLYKNLMKRGR